MRQGAVIAIAGLVTGLAAGLVAARSLSGLLFGVPPADPVALVGTTILLMGTALLACYLPARRAARIDPARTLATE
jgi:putative ABC transport system permease protein